MILEPHQQESFFSNYLPLLFYASVYGGILPPKSTMKDFYSTSLEQKLEARNLVFEDAELIEDYRKDNKPHVKQSHANFLENVANGLLEQFVILEQTKSVAVLMSTETSNFYHVWGITQPLDNIVDFIPSVVQTAIFNFEDKIICDGLIEKKVNIGVNYKKQFKADYKIAKKNHNVIERL
jgi:hypothetical protein